MTASAQENRRVRSIAQAYRDKGYHVTIKPGKADLPDFLGGYDIDVYADNGEDHVVIEVKTRTSLSKSNILLRLAEILEDKPGWRLELVVTNPREGHGDDYRDEVSGQLLDEDEVEERFRQVENLLEQNQVTVAMLLAWTAVEAALRLVALHNEVRLRDQSPAYIVKQLFSIGILDRQQYDILDEAVQFRNTIVHGFRLEPMQRPAVKNLMDTARGIMRSKALLRV